MTSSPPCGEESLLPPTENLVNKTHSSSRQRKFLMWGMIAAAFLGSLWLTACNPRGVPGSVLLTPAGMGAATLDIHLEGTSPTSTAITTTEHTPELMIETQTPAATDTPALSPTVSPTPTIGSTPTRTRYPTKTYPPTRTRRPSKTPTISLTPTPPWAFIRIARPGPLSKIASPLKVEMGMAPGEDGMLYIDLVGEDGRYITRLTKDYRQYLNKQIYTSIDIPFEIPGAAETARLVMSARDRFGRTMALSSLDLVLIKLGDDISTNPGFQQEPFIIRNLKPETAVSGGNLHLEGVARPMNSQPVIFEILNENGSVLATKILQIDPPSGPLSHTPFTVDIPYSIKSSVHARLTMRQISDGRIPGTIALSSLPLQLNP
jgi:hypothetical protein